MRRREHTFGAEDIGPKFKVQKLGLPSQIICDEIKHTDIEVL